MELRQSPATPPTMVARPSIGLVATIRKYAKYGFNRYKNLYLLGKVSLSCCHDFFQLRYSFSFEAIYLACHPILHMHG